MMKAKPTKDMSWSRLENARRIVVNLVRYGFLDSTAAEKAFARMIKLMHKKELTLSQMRALSASLSRNATEKKRKTTAKSILTQLKSVA